MNGPTDELPPVVRALLAELEDRPAWTPFATPDHARTLEQWRLMHERTLPEALGALDAADRVLESVEGLIRWHRLRACIAQAKPATLADMVRSALRRRPALASCADDAFVRTLVREALTAGSDDATILLDLQAAARTVAADASSEARKEHVLVAVLDKPPAPYWIRVLGMFKALDAIPADERRAAVLDYRARHVLEAVEGLTEEDVPALAEAVLKVVASDVVRAAHVASIGLDIAAGVLEVGTAQVAQAVLLHVEQRALAQWTVPAGTAVLLFGERGSWTEARTAGLPWEENGRGWIALVGHPAPVLLVNVRVMRSEAP